MESAGSNISEIGASNPLLGVAGSSIVALSRLGLALYRLADPNVNDQVLKDIAQSKSDKENYSMLMATF